MRRETADCRPQGINHRFLLFLQSLEAYEFMTLL
jgi:hypothetical protein